MGMTESSPKPLRRSSFLETARTFTRGAQKRKAAVDYVLGTLVYDTIRTARDIVTNEIEGFDQQRTFLDQLCAVEEFLKFVYLKHIAVDQDAFHDPGFAFSNNEDSSSDCARISACKTCVTPFQILRGIQSNLKEQRKDLVAALNTTKQNFLLYMGHQHRCLNQEKRIAEVFSTIKNDDRSQSVVVLIDYKMKFEAIRYREKTTDFFGTKGMSWHGAVVFYRTSDGSGSSEVHAGHQTQETRCKTDANEAEIGTVFFDHILSNDMSQDWRTVRWARRLGYVKTLRENFAKRYESELREWFEIGVRDKGRKLRPSRMRKLLKLRKQKGTSTNGTTNHKSRICQGVPSHYVVKLPELMDIEPTLMPRNT